MPIDGAGDGRLCVVRSTIDTAEVERVIPILAQSFAKGFFTEVNCRALPEHFLDRLADEVYRFVRGQGLNETTR